MIQDATALAALTQKPQINQISLKLLQEYYEAYLSPYRYTYELEDGFSFHLDFGESAFCHLVGVESIVKGSIPERLLSKYRGSQGYQNVKDGTVDFAHLKALGGKPKFNASKIKMVHFHLLPQMLDAQNKVVYYKQIVNNIQCQMMIFDVLENAYIHLGIEKNDAGIYVPRTFLIEKVTKTSTGTKFIDAQPDNPIAVRTSSKTAVTPMQPAQVTDAAPRTQLQPSSSASAQIKNPT